MKTITKNCLNPKCLKSFEASLSEVNRGHGKYCSLACSGSHLGSLRPGPTLYDRSCERCYRSFLSIKSTQRFCSRQCKDLAHRDDCQDARTLAFRNFPHKCNRCSWDKEPAVLETHHKDRNRENNKLENLELLCPTDHCLEHFYAKDGKWTTSNAK